MKNLSARRLTLGGDIVASETTDPNAGGGTAAQASSLWLRQGDAAGAPTQIIYNLTGDATNWVIQNLVNLSVFNVKLFGAKGNGVADDTIAINLAITAASASSVGGIIYFPPGTYRITKPAGNVASINLDNAHDLVFLGDGFASQISMIGSAALGDWYAFRLRDGTSRIKFMNLGFTSNITNPDPADQNHFLNISGVAGDPHGGPSDIDVVGCYFRFIVGDAVRTLGESTEITSNVRVLYNDFDMTASRSCVSAQRFTQEVMVVGNFVTGSQDQQIDFEPTSGDGPLAWTIAKNHIDHSTSNSAAAVTLSGTSNTTIADANRRCTVEFNTVTHGGGITANKGIVGCDIVGNICTIDQTVVSSSAAPLDFDQRVQDLVVAGNVAINQNAVNNRIGIRIVSVATLSAPADHLVVADNITNAQGTNCQGISVSDTTETVVWGNIVLVDTSVATVSTGISWVAVDEDIDHIVCAGNLVIGLTSQMKAGFNFSCSGHNLSNAHAIHNFVDSSFTIIQYARTDGEVFGGWRGAIGNNGVAIANVPLSAATNDGVTGDGNPGPAAQIAIVQTAPGPEGNVLSPVGSLCVNTLGGQALVLFYKETGTGVDGGKTGWHGDGADELAMGTQDAGVATAARFLAPGLGLVTVSTVEIQFAMPRPGTLRNMRVQCVAGTGAANVTYTLRKGGVDTAVHATLPNTSSSVTGTGSVAVAAGDLMSMKVTKDAAPAAGQTFVIVSFDLTA